MMMCTVGINYARGQTSTVLSMDILCLLPFCYQGDIDVLDGDDSRTEKFNSSITKLIPDGFNLEWELKQVTTLYRLGSRQLLFSPSSISDLRLGCSLCLVQVYCVVLRHVSLLKRIYHLYTKLGSGNSTFGALSVMQVCM